MTVTRYSEEGAALPSVRLVTMEALNHASKFATRVPMFARVHPAPRRYSIRVLLMKVGIAMSMSSCARSWARMSSRDVAERGEESLSIAIAVGGKASGSKEDEAIVACRYFWKTGDNGIGLSVQWYTHTRESEGQHTFFQMSEDW